MSFFANSCGKRSGTCGGGGHAAASAMPVAMPVAMKIMKPLMRIRQTYPTSWMTVLAHQIVQMSDDSDDVRMFCGMWLALKLHALLRTVLTLAGLLQHVFRSQACVGS